MAGLWVYIVLIMTHRCPSTLGMLYLLHQLHPQLPQFRADHEMPLSLNTNHVALTTTSATSPIAPAPQDLALGNETEENPVSNESLKLYGNDEAFYKADHGMLPLLNTNHVALSTLAPVTSPVAPVPQDLTLKDQTEAHSMSTESFSD